MSQIKDDLICEIIRISQTNLLSRKREKENGQCDEQKVLEWIQQYAKFYREKFEVLLDESSARELAEILKKLTKTGTDLEEILGGQSFAPTESRPSP